LTIATADERIALDVAEFLPFGSHKTYDLLRAPSRKARRSYRKQVA
jgi:hypothetical protein